jgi:hypothetical protein
LKLEAISGASTAYHILDKTKNQASKPSILILEARDEMIGPDMTFENAKTDMRLQAVISNHIHTSKLTIMLLSMESRPLKMRLGLRLII